MQIPFKNNTSTSRDHSTCYSVQAITLDACESKNLVLGVITSEVKKALFREKLVLNPFHIYQLQSLGFNFPYSKKQLGKG
jgi:hypothetical protein